MLAGGSPGFRAPTLHVPLSTALGLADAAGVGDVGGGGTAAQEVDASKGPAAGLSDSSFAEEYGQQQQPPPAAGGGVDQLDALMLLPAAGGNAAGDEGDEDDSDANIAPAPIPIPEGLHLKSRSWCCSRPETTRSICGVCRTRWHCHVQRYPLGMSKATLICCRCKARPRRHL